jgi:hypothetical protein
MLPGNDPDLFLKVNRTVYDILPEQLYPKLEVDSSCNQTLWDVVIQDPILSALKGIWGSLDSSAKNTFLLENPSNSITLFVMVDEAFFNSAQNSRSKPTCNAPLESLIQLLSSIPSCRPL